MKIIHRLNGFGLPLAAGFSIHAAMNRPIPLLIFCAVVFTACSLLHHVKRPSTPTNRRARTNRSRTQQQIIDAARERMKDKPWFRGVCVNNLPSDPEIAKMGIPEAVDQLVDDTMTLDAN